MIFCKKIIYVGDLKKGLINIKGSKLNKKLKPNEINNTKPRDFNNSYSKRWNYKNNSITIKEKDNKNNNISNKNNIGTMIQIDHMKLFDRELGERFIAFSGIEARSGSKSSLLEFASLSSHEVPTERSEGEARSQTETILLDFGSLSFGKVPTERSEGEARDEFTK